MTKMKETGTNAVLALTADGEVVDTSEVVLDLKGLTGGENDERLVLVLLENFGRGILDLHTGEGRDGTGLRSNCEAVGLVRRDNRLGGLEEL